MFQVSDVVQLNPHEQVQALVRVHVAYLWAKLLIAAGLLIIPFFFLFSLLRGGVIGITVFILLTSAGILLALRSFFLWDAQVLILTDQRLVYVIQRSLWHRIVSETSLETIRDLQWEQMNVIERILHCGTVRIKTGASSVPDMTAARIPGPEELVRAIKSFREKNNASHPIVDAIQAHETSLDERRERIHAWVSEAPADTIHILEKLLHQHGPHQKK